MILFVSKKYIFKYFSDIEIKNFRLNDKVFSTGMTKLHYACPEEQFEEKKSFEKSFFLYDLRTLSHN